MVIGNPQGRIYLVPFFLNPQEELKVPDHSIFFFFGTLKRNLKSVIPHTYQDGLL